MDGNLWEDIRKDYSMRPKGFIEAKIMKDNDDDEHHHHKQTQVYM